MRSVPVPDHLGRLIDEMVARGDYPDAGAVMQAAIQVLRDRDDAVEQWLRDEVAPTFDAMKADPARGIKAVDVETAIAACRARRGAIIC